MAYTQVNYATGPGYNPRHNPGQDFPNQGFTPLKMYQCGYCNFQSYRSNHVKRHSEKKHPRMSVEIIKPATPLKKYKCGFCNYQSERTSNVIRHAEKKHLGMNVTISKPGGVIVENTQQPTGFYPSKHIEKIHPEIINRQNISGEGPLQNIYYTDRYSGRDKYEKQKNDIGKNTNLLGSEVDSHKISDNYYKEDIEKIKPRGNGQVQTDFRGFGQVKPDINKIDDYKSRVPFEYLKEDYENFGHDILRKQFEWLKSATPDLFTYVISELNLHHRPYKNSTGHIETNKKFSGDSMLSDETCEETKYPDFKKYRKIS